MQIRTFRPSDEAAVIALWERAGIDRPWLDLHAEVAEKRRRDRSLFLVAVDHAEIIGAVMGAYDGRRGWVYHLAVDPPQQRRGLGNKLMEALEHRMLRLGVRKVNLQVRADNPGVASFYEGLGYVDEQLTSFGKWLGRRHDPQDSELD
ncbi:MAG: acetyltransferase [Chloroflexi bacterium]|nr:acetyltransferase [Chloroflexota bacterium]